MFKLLALSNQSFCYDGNKCFFFYQLIIALENLENVECTRGSTGDWYPIRQELTAIERDYLRENKQSLILESDPSYIVVGATGGIAVVVLAISIFWGLSGSTFAQN